MKWECGRQEATSSIKKLKIWSRWNTDCYLLKFDKGCVIEAHKDPVPSKRHFRLNITLYGEWCFFTEDSNYGTLQRMGSRHLFRPDIVEHSAHVMTGTLILSLGICLND
jgi:hypothetical protein